MGEDHNLIVLREKVLAEPAYYGRDTEIGFFVSLMDRYHEELRGNALSVGERIYEEKPGRFTRRIKHLWDAWQAEPNGIPQDTISE